MTLRITPLPNISSALQIAVQALNYGQSASPSKLGCYR